MIPNSISPVPAICRLSSLHNNTFPHYPHSPHLSHQGLASEPVVGQRSGRVLCWRRARSSSVVWWISIRGAHTFLARRFSPSRTQRMSRRVLRGTPRVPTQSRISWLTTRTHHSRMACYTSLVSVCSSVPGGGRGKGRGLHMYVKFLIKTEDAK